MPQRVTVGVDQVRRLVDDQFPQWSALPVRPVDESGWDNVTFRLGDTMVVRLPSAAEYALAVDKEQRWLPALAARLPLPIPAPLAKGRADHGYPFSWSIYRWLPGEPASADGISDPVRFALDLAGFLAALRSVDAADGPQPGKHNWFRGATLRTYDAVVQRAFATLDGRIDVGLAREIWETALDAPWDGVDVWFHGDVAPGNLLLDGGELAAVIDFGTCGVGDPSCDLAIAWTLLTADGRKVFRERLSVDDAAWARGRGWALWKALIACTRADEEARRVLDEIFSEFPNAARDQPSERLVLQRMRNRVMEALDLLADGDEGVRSAGNAEYVNHFFDFIDDDVPLQWREWSTLTADEVAALDKVLRALLDACAETPAVCTDDEFIASGWPERVKQIAGAALALMRARGRFHEEYEEDSPSITG